MKNTGIVAAAVLVAAISSARGEIVLRCDGYNRQLNGLVYHYVTIDGTKGTVDGVPYTVTSSETDYWLDRPGVRMQIDRTDGSYSTIDPNHPSAGLSDWSRPDDPGCRKAEPKF